MNPPKKTGPIRSRGSQSPNYIRRQQPLHARRPDHGLRRAESRRDRRHANYDSTADCERLAADEILSLGVMACVSRVRTGVVGGGKEEEAGRLSFVVLEAMMRAGWVTRLCATPQVCGRSPSTLKVGLVLFGS